jgi:Ca2+-binding RTX toxin-like protein
VTLSETQRLGVVFEGDGGDDTIVGSTRPDRIRGDEGSDLLIGRNGNDTLTGGDSTDSLAGGAGNDRIFGGTGQDELAGGSGADVFGFFRAADSQSSLRDMITDFVRGQDKVDLSSLGPLDFIGSGSFSSAGQARAIVSHGQTLLQVNTAGTGGPEMTIAFSTVINLGESDLLL